MDMKKKEEELKLLKAKYSINTNSSKAKGLHGIFGTDMKLTVLRVDFTVGARLLFAHVLQSEAMSSTPAPSFTGSGMLIVILPCGTQ
ncbi:hypothetical protein CB1_000688088 [Camelus ferus]|nr:hypothetical protein CB1_000688088 [Camelus ferus]